MGAFVLWAQLNLDGTTPPVGAVVPAVYLCPNFRMNPGRFLFRCGVLAVYPGTVLPLPLIIVSVSSTQDTVTVSSSQDSIVLSSGVA